MLNFIGAFSQQTLDPNELIEYSIWGPGVPGTLDEVETVPLVLGTRFYTSTPGLVRGIRFYKDATSAGCSHVALWQGTTNVSGTVAVTGQTASGWQRMDFPEPIAIDSGTTYTTSALYHENRYQAQNNYFSAASFTNGPITCPQGTVTPNGVYLYSGTMAAPTSQFNYTSYFIDVIFAA